MYTRFNFHKHTFCVFKEVTSSVLQDKTPNYTSNSGSVYFFTHEGVYRQSNHWGRVANCRWRLETLYKDQISKSKVGYARWTDFYRDNETEALYFIQIVKRDNEEEAYYQHKDHHDYSSSKDILRSGSLTAKRILLIKEIISTNAWAKYLDSDDLEVTRNQIIEQLVYTNKSVQEIKRGLVS